MSIPWTLVENSDMFSFTGIQPKETARRIHAFLDQHIKGMSYIFNEDEIMSTRQWHLYYHTPINEATPRDDVHFRHTAGTVEFRQIFVENVGWRHDAFEWRMIDESCSPLLGYNGLPLRVLHSLTVPAFNREAERWRYQSWARHGVQPPPYVGMGVTYCSGSDRYPYVVVEANTRLKSVAVAQVDYQLVRGSVFSENQQYEFGERRSNQSWLI